MEAATPGPWSKYGGGTTKTKITDGYFGEGYRIEGRTASWNTISQELSCSAFTQVSNCWTLGYFILLCREISTGVNGLCVFRMRMRNLQ